MKVRCTVRNAEWAPSVYITQYHFSVGLNNRDELIMFDSRQSAILGKFDKKKIDSLCEALQRLKCHLPE